MHTSANDYPSWSIQDKGDSGNDYIEITKEMLAQAEKDDGNIEYKFLIKCKVRIIYFKGQNFIFHYKS